MAASFCGAFVGWIIAYAAHLLRQVYGKGFGYPTDVAFWRFWTALVVSLWWLLLIVPFVLFARFGARLFKPFAAPVVGALWGIGGYFLIIGWQVGPHPDCIRFAAIVGVVTWLLTSLIIQSHITRSAAPASMALRTSLWFGPSAFLLAWIYVIWPAAGHISPQFEYRFSDVAGQQRVVRRVLHEVKPGDPYTKLTEKLPERFPPLASTFGYAGSSGGSEYQLTVLNGTIKEIRFGD